jgi:hypothetical protein
MRVGGWRGRPESCSESQGPDETSLSGTGTRPRSLESPDELDARNQTTVAERGMVRERVGRVLGEGVHTLAPKDESRL